MAAAAEGAGPVGQLPLSVFYGSQTGTAEEVAWDIAREARRRGVLCGDPVALDEIDLQGLRSTRLAVFVVATTGQGDPPLNMRRLWQDLLTASLDNGFLKALRFAVFGLGDSHYREFNYAARKLHARLTGLGAEMFFRLGLGDDQHDFGLEQELDPWAEGMWEALQEIQPSRMRGHDASELVPECRYEVTELCAAAATLRRAPEAPAAGPAEFDAQVVENRCLCTEAHGQEQQDVRNIRLRAPPGKHYEAGDVCVVWPRLRADLVERFVVETLGLSLHTVVQVWPVRQNGAMAAYSIFPDAPVTLEEVFTSYVDTSAVPTRYFFHVLSQYTDHEVHRNKLSELASRTLEAKNTMYEYCKRERRSAAEARHAEIAQWPAEGRGRLRDLLFLGFRHQHGDNLYGDEWAAYGAWLAVHFAFSRDHEDRKVYVQDCVEEQGAHVCDLLDAGAQVFVCGRSHPMPSQVFDAFTEVLHIHRGLSMEEAAGRLRAMQRTRRYICDTWG